MWAPTQDGIIYMYCTGKLSCDDSLLNNSEFITPNLVIKECEFACS